MTAPASYGALVLGFLLMAGIIAAAFVSDSTFGARCERMHPGDALAQERCIFDLSKGQRP